MVRAETWPSKLSIRGLQGRSKKLFQLDRTWADFFFQIREKAAVVNNNNNNNSNKYLGGQFAAAEGVQ